MKRSQTMESVGDPLGTKLLPTGLALAALAITYGSRWFVQAADYARSSV
jgi:hypothetical protein